MGLRQDAADLLVFPTRVQLVDVPEDRLEAVLAVLYKDAAGPGSIAALQAAVGPGARAEPLPADERYMFVCVHGARDDRCGRCRDGLLPALRARAATARPRIRVWGTSHVGGHVHAGNVLYGGGGGGGVVGGWVGGL